VELSEGGLRWLRAAWSAPPGPHRPPAELVLDGLTVAELARRTPAWTERHAGLLDRLLAAHDARAADVAAEDEGEQLRLEAGRQALLAARDGLAGPGEGSLPRPQVVDVDFPALALRRAEWVAGSLHLELAPERPDPAARARFQVVGIEPRMWYQTGIDGATTDVTSHAMVVHVPLVAGRLEFTPGSY
jgi:hypothetical protein